MRLALAQINTTVGDIRGNAEKILSWTARARDEGADLVLFPELALSGYPGEDLYLQPHFTRSCAEALNDLAREIRGISALIGFPDPVGTGASRSHPGMHDRASAQNSLALVTDGAVAAIYRKSSLPSYGVFDELRQFVPSDGAPFVIEVAGLSAGLTVCEDGWNGGEIARREVAAGASLILNASASPWYAGRGPERQGEFSRLARDLGKPVVVCNLVGAQDGLVFEGQSFVMDVNGAVVARASQFGEELLLCDFENGRPAPVGGAAPSPELRGIEEIRAGLILGLRDYVAKNGFEGVVFGLSGGIDSALVAALAAEALGPDRVTCLVMPSPHSSSATQDDARRMARNLGTRLLDLPIAAAMDAYDEILAAAGEAAGGVTAENIQARIRGNLVMAISNRDGALALSCGNKSEAAVGYATLYGDMAGGLAPIKDLYKTSVYALARHLNGTPLTLPAGGTVSEPIPPDIIERPPSAELRPGQADTDSLPPYDQLDQALEAHIERDLGRAEMIAEGIDPGVADRVIHLVAISEHKRRQSAPGIRVTPKALDRDRRMPVTNGYRSR